MQTLIRIQGHFWLRELLTVGSLITSLSFNYLLPTCLMAAAAHGRGVSLRWGGGGLLWRGKL